MAYRRGNSSSTLIALAIAAAVYAGIYVGQALWPGTGHPLSFNPLSAAIQLSTGESGWPPGSTIVLILWVPTFVALLIFLSRRRNRAKSHGARGTALERRVNAGADVKRIGERGRRAELAHLHPDADTDFAGIRIGRALAPGRPWVMQSYRQCSLHIWGPGRGKTYTQVVRHAYEAPGPYAMTSNKPDGVREVIAARMLRHPEGRVWIFDPAGVFRPAQRPAFTIDVLAMVSDTETARKVATLFETAGQGRKVGGGDLQFEPAGRGFLANALLAAAVSNKDLTQVHRWVSEGETTDPADLLANAGYRGPVAALRGLAEQPDRTRGSVFATAQRMAEPMEHDHLMRWAVATPGVPVFDPAAFVTSTDTLIILTKDKAGPLAAFVSALVTQTITAGVAAATRSPSGRLPLPLIMDLDECGNVVTLHDMPEWFTYFGSLAMILNAYYQSPSQGEAVHGAEGFKQMWDAAGTRVYGGGIDDERWLSALSKLLGDYEKVTYSKSVSGGVVTRSESTQEHARATVAELANLPEWRAIVRTSNGVSAIVETVPAFSDPALADVMRAAAQIRG